MTPEEIAQTILHPYYPNGTNEPLQEAIAEAICEAKREAYEDTLLEIGKLFRVLLAASEEGE